MTRLTLAFAVISLCTVTLAEAQPMGGGPGRGKPPAGMGGGMGGPSPVMMACKEDMAKTCPGLMGMPGVQCLMDNITDLSDPCADALGTAMDNMRGNHGQGADGNDN